MAGRPINVQLQEMRTTFYERELNRLIIENHIVKSNDEVFFELAKVTGNSKQSEYNAFLRYARKNNLLIKRSSEEEYSDVEYESYKSKEEFSAKIEPNMFFVEGTEKLKNRSSFTDTLIHIIFEQARKPCAWKLGPTQKTENGEIRIDAICSMSGCNARLLIFTQKTHTELVIVVFDYDGSVPHSKHRYVTEELSQKKLNTILSTESAFTTHTILANEYIGDDLVYPAHLSSKDALKQRKYRLNKGEYRHEIATVAVAMMKEERNYADTIHVVGISPVQVIYGTPTQKEWLRSETNWSRRIVISIDATGVAITPPAFAIKSNKGDVRKSFLYMITLHGQKKNVPVFQMINQLHDHNSIASFLMFFQGRFFNGKTPDEVILDDSSALILAVIKAFTQFRTFREYMNGCYSCLFESKEAPHVFIRLDRSHFVVNIIRNKELNTLQPKAKNLYRRVLGYLITVENVEEARQVILDLFIVAKNEYIFNDSIAAAKNKISELARSHKYVFEEVEIDGDEKWVDTENDNDSQFKSWVKSIIKEVDEKFVPKRLNDSSESSEFSDNIFFIPSNICDELIEILSKLPMFSNVMMAKFNSKSAVATSSPTENAFGRIKSHVFNKKKGMRLDKYVEKSINTINGHCKSLLAKTQTENTVTDSKLNEKEGDIEIPIEQRKQAKNRKPISRSKVKPNEEEESSLSESELPRFGNFCTVNKQENSKMQESFDEDNLGNTLEFENFNNDNTEGKDKPYIRKRKRATRSILNDRQVGTCVTVPILKNGARTPGNKQRKAVVSYNTCGFDSIWQILVSTCADRDSFRFVFEMEECSYTTLLLYALQKKVLKPVLYKHRNEILMQIMTENKREYDKFIEIDAKSLITTMYQRVCSAFTPLYSCYEEIVCPACSDVSSRAVKPFVRMNLGLLNVKSICESIKEMSTKPLIEKCKKCDSNLEMVQSPNSIMTLDIEGCKECTLPDIPRCIETKNGEYVLLGAVEAMHNKEHFRAHVLRSNGLFETHDDMYPDKKQTVSLKSKLKLALLMYGENQIEPNEND